MILYNIMSSRRAEIYNEQEDKQKLQKGLSHMLSHIFPLSSLYSLFLPDQQVVRMRGGHIVLTACVTQLQSDIITPFIFIQSDRTERQRKRERADDVQAKPQLIAFQFACKCWSEAEWRLGEKQHSSHPKGWALTTHTSQSQITLLTIDKPQTYQMVNLNR